MTADARWYAVVVSLTMAGCASSQPGDTTGSILPRLPSMPSLPSVGQFVPSFGSAPSRVERIGSNLFRISTSANAFPDATRRENYTMLRAAEVTQEAGGTHFSVVTLGGEWAGANQDAPVLVRVLTVEAGAEPPSGAVSAGEMIHFYAPQFDRTTGTAAGSAQVGGTQVAGGNSTTGPVETSAPAAGLPASSDTNWGPAALPSQLKPTMAAGEELEGDRGPATRNAKATTAKAKSAGVRTKQNGSKDAGAIAPTDRGTLPLLRGT